MKHSGIFVIMFFFTFLYTYYVGAQTSMFILYMFLVCIPVSLLLTYPVRKCFDIEIEVPSSEVERDSIAQMRLVIRNKSFLPVPFVMIDFSESENLSLQMIPETHYAFSPYESKSISVLYRADFRGVSEIGIKSLAVQDYLGLFSFSLLKDLQSHQYTGKITVLPRISEMKLSDRIMNPSQKTNLTEVSSTASAQTSSWFGEPGHEYREYCAGDPLHRIHWKLSAKTDQLMVRKNEGGGMPKKSLILDPCLYTLQKSNKKTGTIKLQEIEDKLLEALLSITSAAIQLGRLAEIWFFEEGHWQMESISNRYQLMEFQRHLAGYRFTDIPFSDSSHRLPLLPMLNMHKTNRNYKGEEAILFTGYYDSLLESSIKNSIQYNLSVNIVLVTDKAKQHKDSTEIVDTSDFSGQTVVIGAFDKT
jgi:uncharacterized protein (DUF58 family)